MQPEIIHATHDFVFINKPSGILSIPDRQEPDLPNVKRWLQKKEKDVFVIHRIDKDTSGMIMMALNAEAHRHASMQFEHRTVNKKYVGIVLGTPSQSEGVVDKALMEHPTIKGKMTINARLGKEAITDYKILESFAGYTLMEFTIHTGRMHQIRVHSANLGCPLVCDPIYGQMEGIFISRLKKKFKLGKFVEEEQPILNRLALHAQYIGIQGLNEDVITVEAPLYKDMAATLNQMRKWVKI
jgi:23S rRNA pseudouridine1911/1915/1917 synthase